MSYSLTSGYLIKEGVSPHEVQKAVQQTITPALKKRNIEQLLSRVAAEIDHQTWLGKEVLASSSFYDIYKKECDQYKGIYGSMVLTNVSVTLFWNEVRQQQYAYFSGDSSLEHMFASLDVVESEFNYWDGSDSYLSLGFTEEEWKDHKAAWLETVDLNRGLREQGLNIRLLSEYDVLGLQLKKIVALLEEDVVRFPSNDFRAEQLGVELFCKENSSEHEDKDAMVMEVMRLITEYKQLEQADKQFWMDKAKHFVKNISFS